VAGAWWCTRSRRAWSGRGRAHARRQRMWTASSLDRAPPDGGLVTHSLTSLGRRGQARRQPVHGSIAPPPFDPFAAYHHARVRSRACMRAASSPCCSSSYRAASCVRHMQACMAWLAAARRERGREREMSGIIARMHGGRGGLLGGTVSLVSTSFVAGTQQAGPPAIVDPGPGPAAS
jgi:hypothetical protein